MISRSRFCFFILFACTSCVDFESVLNAQIYRESPETTHAGKNKADRKVAKILKLSGKVSVKRAFSHSWFYIEEGAALEAGDRVFTQKNSRAHIEYFGTGASLGLQPLSYFTMTENLPQFSRFKTKAGMQKRIFQKATLNTKQSDGHTLAKSDSANERATAQQYNAFGMTFERDVTKIPLLLPKGNVKIYAKQFPAEFEIELEKALEDVGLWCYLWRVSENSVKPVWVGFQVGSRQTIKLADPGEYKLQMFTEDESRTTGSVAISAFFRSQFPEKRFDLLTEAVTVYIK